MSKKTTSEADLDTAVRGAYAVLVGSGPLAITIQYADDMNVPVVSSKSRRAAARYVVRTAQAVGVRVLEVYLHPFLVWRLEAVRTGQQIPRHLYRAVAAALTLAGSSGKDTVTPTAMRCFPKQRKSSKDRPSPGAEEGGGTG